MKEGEHEAWVDFTRTRVKEKDRVDDMYEWKIGPRMRIDERVTDSEWIGPRVYNRAAGPWFGATFGHHNWFHGCSQLNVWVGADDGYFWYGRGVTNEFLSNSGEGSCWVRLKRGRMITGHLLCHIPDLDLDYECTADSRTFWLGRKLVMRVRTNLGADLGPQVRLSHRDGDYLHYTLDDRPILVARKFDDGWRFGHSPAHIMTQKLLAA